MDTIQKKTRKKRTSFRNDITYVERAFRVDEAWLERARLSRQKILEKYGQVKE